MRDATLILASDELLPFLAQARQGGAHAMPLPTSGLAEITDRGAVRPLQQRDDGGLLEQRAGAVGTLASPPVFSRATAETV